MGCRGSQGWDTGGGNSDEAGDLRGTRALKWGHMQIKCPRAPMQTVGHDKTEEKYRTANSCDDVCIMALH
jgi:hypothetical protein